MAGDESLGQKHP